MRVLQVADQAFVDVLFVQSTEPVLEGVFYEAVLVEDQVVTSSPAQVVAERAGEDTEQSLVPGKEDVAADVVGEAV